MIHLFYEVVCKHSNSILLAWENTHNMMLREKTSMQIVFTVWSQWCEWKHENKARQNVDRLFLGRGLISERFLFIYAFSFPEQKCLKKSTAFSCFKREELGHHHGGANSLFLDDKINLKFWKKAVFHIWPNSEVAQGDGEMSLVLHLVWLV